MTILNRIKDYKLQEIIVAKKKQSMNDLMHMVREQNHVPRGFFKALQAKKQVNQIGLIAEIKKASPSKGIIRVDFDVPSLACAYEQGGATCLSILTDMPSFQGHDNFLALGRNAVQLPVLRKDFMFDIYQIVQSAALGADCILLIMACLDNHQAIELEQVAFEYNMDVLIETHNYNELERALTYLKSDLIGINNRDLHSFKTDITTSEHLVKLLPAEKLCVSESGISTIDDIKRLQKHTIQSFLIGESLMRQENVSEATQTITQFK